MVRHPLGKRLIGLITGMQVRVLSPAPTEASEMLKIIVDYYEFKDQSGMKFIGILESYNEILQIAGYGVRVAFNVDSARGVGSTPTTPASSYTPIAQQDSA